jgi:hypothetical protein
VHICYNILGIFRTVYSEKDCDGYLYILEMSKVELICYIWTGLQREPLVTAMLFVIEAFRYRNDCLGCLDSCVIYPELSGCTERIFKLCNIVNIVNIV